jgi:phosphoribosylanthranilate isomerase
MTRAESIVKVKICGITSLKDAEKALELGADMLGFNFYPPSPRAIGADEARAIIERLPAASCNIALFVNQIREKVLEIASQGRRSDGSPAYGGLQFHGEENADYCRGWKLKVIKAFRLKEKASLAGMKDFPADFCLLDSWSPGYGGSGGAFPWEWLEDIDASRLILSGGLRADNVGEAVRRIRPFGVDVCSGVEARPGVKDYAKLKDFIDAAKRA